MNENIRSPFVDPGGLSVRNETSSNEWQSFENFNDEENEHIHEHEEPFSFETREDLTTDELPLEIRALMNAATSEVMESGELQEFTGEEEANVSFEQHHHSEEAEVEESEFDSSFEHHTHEEESELEDQYAEEETSTDEELDELSYNAEELYEIEELVEMEDELSKKELSTATGLNFAYMGTLMWANHLKEVSAFLKKVTGIEVNDSTGKTNNEQLAKAVAKFQELRGMKPTNKGALAISTWSRIQDEMGYLLYDKPIKIDLNKAKAANLKYEKQLWGGYKIAILNYFSILGITKHGLPLDSKYFSLVVARWQTMFPIGDKVDGILGPNTWKRIKELLGKVASVPISKWDKIMTNAVKGSLKPLAHGQETFKEMIAAIESARNEEHYIYIMGWMLETEFKLDGKAKTLKSLLDAAIKRNVQVRVLIWDNPLYFSANNRSKHIINSLTDLNGSKTALMVLDNATFATPEVKSALLLLKQQVALINSTVTKILAMMAAIPGLGYKAASYLVSLIKYTTILNRLRGEGSHHEKILIVKGTNGLTGFCGGIDINENRISGKDALFRSTILHDVHCKVQGTAAMPLLNRFIERWKVISINPAFDQNNLLRKPLRGASESNPGQPATDEHIGMMKVIHTYNHPTDSSIKKRSIRKTILDAIAAATSSIHIECQYMISLEIADALNKKLTDSKFKVFLVSQDDSFAGEDIQFPKHFRNNFIAHLTRGMSADKIKDQVHYRILHPLLPLDGHHALHSKVLIADNELAIIGSQNCSSRSLTFDSETAIAFVNDKGASGKFVEDLLLKLNYDFYKKDTKSTQVNTVTYIPNPNTGKDLDEMIEQEIRIILNMPLVSTVPGLEDILNSIIKLLPSIKQQIIQIIEPQENTPVIEKEIEEAQLVLEKFVENEVTLHNFNMIDYENFESEFIDQESGYQGTICLSPKANQKATLTNAKNAKASGIQLDALKTAISRFVNFETIRKELESFNQKNPATPYSLNDAAIDATFSEAVCQFQKLHFFDKKEHDGILGPSTLDTLGFEKHGLRPKLNSSGFYGQKQINQIASKISAETNGEFTTANWYDYLVKPAWMGVKISDGIHILLYRKLKQAEAWLLEQPQYKGMSPVQLGEALGFKGIRFSGARLSAEKQAMHGVGLAIDIDGYGNPWIGAGWIQHDPVKLSERTRMLAVLKKTSGENLPGKTIFAYLHSIAESNGNDTNAAWSVLQRRNDEFISYLKTNPSEYNFWRQSASFDNRDPGKGFFHQHKDLVYALRQIAGLAWGAIDFGPYASGDIMHFDLRTQGVGKVIAKHMGGFIPKSGHPAIQSELATLETEETEIVGETETETETGGEWEFHEELGESEYAEELVYEFAEEEEQ